MKDSTGRREGRHASGDSENSHVSKSYFLLFKNKD